MRLNGLNLCQRRISKQPAYGEPAHAAGRQRPASGHGCVGTGLSGRGRRSRHAVPNHSGTTLSQLVEGSPAGGSQGSGILANPIWRPNQSGYNRPCHERARRFPAPWTVEETAPCFTVRDHNGQALRLRVLRGRAGPARHRQAAHARRGPPDRGQHRQTAGVIAQVLNPDRR